ncbi:MULTISPECIES: rRNA maturation RNase YbeY [unclassified Oceanispirochaeta]|uniref:rRNA maturation RNase YbeY n=1 Tax=unclassified Oceanispirochaeta TaxID=2635722 RepID=UPI000E091F12|nr:MULTISPECIES: rRNA maturation RNase YbeY [unclassified Oceanispirochaeta]MBF9015056.1 rRNA maturation RNase YbeY [Oceanispirochaeta sp. M2]NPD71514.1 rRNA maturation RNase YbeY [Oceanispirochaeta sp. M1]RDG33088.1 rRNA maturation RNase YbeY [Oceanispirochaeta sp. M1]
MTEIDIISRLEEEPGWLENYSAFVQAVLTLEDLTEWEISLTLCHDAYIKELNATYRDKDEATDVLSFCQNEGDEIMSFPGQQLSAGDIIVSMDTLERNAELYSVPLEEELKRVTIHGILHLKGMTHETREPEEKMLQYQENLLEKTAEFKVF